MIDQEETTCLNTPQEQTPKGTPQGTQKHTWTKNKRKSTETEENNLQPRKGSRGRGLSQSRKPQPEQKTPSNLWTNLQAAVLLVIIDLAEFINAIVLAAHYFQIGYNLSGLSIIGVLVCASATAFLWEYFNCGVCYLTLLHFFELRKLTKLIEYIKQWRYTRSQGVRVIDSFQPNHGFESGFRPAPLLVIQTFVYMVKKQEDVTFVEYTATGLSSASIIMHLVHFFEYLDVQWSTYAVMVTKGIINTSLRIALLALFVVEIGKVTVN